MYIISQLGFIFTKIYIRIFLFLKKSENLQYLNIIFFLYQEKIQKIWNKFSFYKFLFEKSNFRFNLFHIQFSIWYKWYLFFCINDNLLSCNRIIFCPLFNYHFLLCLHLIYLANKHISGYSRYWKLDPSKYRHVNSSTTAE